MKARGRAVEGVEQSESDCFLCEPDTALVVRNYALNRLIAGLGPILPNYCLLSAIEHLPSYADVMNVKVDAIDELVEIRARLEDSLGPILMTEHGKVPVCRDDKDHHEAHCYHAHLLLFPNAPDISSPAQSYYRQHQVFQTLIEALRAAQLTDNYLLLSSNRKEFIVMSEPFFVPRQLTRTLVSHLNGNAMSSDWRTQPDYEAALRNAATLKEMV